MKIETVKSNIRDNLTNFTGYLFIKFIPPAIAVLIHPRGNPLCSATSWICL